MANVREMTPRDIPAGMRLVESAGWNQTEADWRRFLNLSSGGCFAAEVDGDIHGTSATVVYEGRVAWIGMMLVSPERRGKGIGKQLFAAALDHLDANKIPTVKLDATPAGRPLYERFGFRPEYEIERWRLDAARREGAMHAGAPGNSGIEQIIETDALLFGAARGGLLRSIHADAPELAATVWRDGKLAGLTMGRHGTRADHLGPLVADSQQNAERLLRLFLAQTERPILVDCVKAHRFASGILRAYGFEFSRPLLRMARGVPLRPTPAPDLCAILGPEFG